MTSTPPPATATVDLCWIPLGAGEHVVRLSGKTYEALKAFSEHRPRYALYHTALEVAVSDGRFVIESAPIPNLRPWERGVVGEGRVGMRLAGGFRLFRYEIRRWHGGTIPDASEAVSRPIGVADDASQAQRVLDLVPSVPTPRRDVELQLSDVVAAGTGRGGHRSAQAAIRRSSARLECRSRRRTTRDETKPSSS